MTDILLGLNDDLSIENGDFEVGDSLIQEVGVIIRLQKGELKSDPLMGPNLVRLINSNIDAVALESVLKINLERDRKNYEEVRNLIQMEGKINGG